jgi:hypothetical protein
MMTPRQLAGTLFFRTQAEPAGSSEQLALGALATRGEQREVKRKIDQLQRDA